MGVIIGNGIGDPSSNPDKAVYVSLCANALGKGMNPSVFLPAMGKL